MHDRFLLSRMFADLPRDPHEHGKIARLAGTIGHMTPEVKPAMGRVKEI